MHTIAYCNVLLCFDIIWCYPYLYVQQQSWICSVQMTTRNNLTMNSLMSFELILSAMQALYKKIISSLLISITEEHIAPNENANTKMALRMNMFLIIWDVDVFWEVFIYDKAPQILIFKSTVDIDTVQCRYNAVNFIQNLKNRHQGDMEFLSYFVNLYSDLYSTSFNAVLYEISSYIGPTYNGTALYLFFDPPVISAYIYLVTMEVPMKMLRLFHRLLKISCNR